jgi:hypothetical protein
MLSHIPTLCINSSQCVNIVRSCLVITPTIVYTAPFLPKWISHSADLLGKPGALFLLPAVQTSTLDTAFDRVGVLEDLYGQSFVPLLR